MSKIYEWKVPQSRYPNGQQAHEKMLNIISHQIKTTIRYHFIPTSMAIVKKTDDNRNVEKSEPHTLIIRL